MEEYVQLGVAGRRAPPANACPSDSRVGGQAFYSPPPSPPICDTCRTPLLLLLQMFAPTDRERTLYIFGCNSASCNRSLSGEFHHGSWKVYRSQGELLAGSSAPAAAGSVSGPTPASCPVSADSTSFGAEDGWGNAGDWGDASEATGASRWGDVPASPDTKPDVLPAPARPTYLMKLARTLPCYDVSNMYEPEGSDAEDSDEEVEGSVSASAARRHADASDDAALAHAKKLWAEYQSWEASTSALSKEAPTSGAARCDPDSERDASTSSLVPGHGAEAEMEGMESADSDGEELATDVTSAARGVAASVHADGRVAGGKDWDGEHPKSTRKAAQRRVSGGDKRAGVMRTDRGGSALVSSRGADSDDDEKLPPAVAASLAFQRRLQRLPTQCVRYSFGTQPLWPHVPPKGWDAAIPRCVCGARRLFECQLMPALLQQLCVDEHVVCTPSPDTAAVRTPPPPPAANTKRSAGTKSTARAAGAGAGSSDSASASSPPALLSMLDTGMDFSTVLVYSCEDSCDMSNEELAFVLPPL